MTFSYFTTIFSGSLYIPPDTLKYFPHNARLLLEHEIVDMNSSNEYLLLTGEVNGQQPHRRFLLNGFVSKYFSLIMNNWNILSKFHFCII